MDNTAIQNGLIAAKKKIESLPEEQQGPLLAMLEETRNRHVMIEENCQQARTAMEDLRLSLAYLAFDYEATMREVSEWRKNGQRDNTERDNT